MAERLSPPVSNELLTEALNLKRRREEEKRSVEEAKPHIPKLERKILGLLGIEIPRVPTPEEDHEMAERLLGNAKTPRKLSEEEMAEIMKQVSKNIAMEFKPIIANFEIPLDDKTIEVSLAKGRRRDGYHRIRDESVDVVISDLEQKLVINENGAVVESTVRKSEPFTMHTPIGARVRSWPEWQRQMNMEDFENYNSLLDRLSEPDVIRVGEF
jgi:hypothetical protein